MHVLACAYRQHIHAQIIVAQQHRNKSYASNHGCTKHRYNLLTCSSHKPSYGSVVSGAQSVSAVLKLYWVPYLCFPQLKEAVNHYFYSIASTA